MNFWRSIALTVTVVFGFLCSAWAQERWIDGLQVGANYHYGAVLPEYSMFYHIVEENTQAVELYFSKQMTGKKYWEELFKYPEHGVALYYSTLGNDSIFGREWAANYSFKVYLAEFGKWKFFNRTGIGLGYTNRKFNLKNNYWNVAVGSSLNIHFNFRWGLNYEISDKLASTVCLSFDHFSNANISEPNLGINWVALSVGMRYTLGTSPDKIHHELEPHEDFNQAFVWVSLGHKHSRSLSAEYFQTLGLSAEVERSLARAFHVGLGVDFFYDPSVKVKLEREEETFKSWYNMQAGIHLSQTLVYNRFSLTLQEGVYILPNHLVDAWMYNRAIFRYRLTDKWYVRGTMKSHLYILDFPEFGIGVKL